MKSLLKAGILALFTLGFSYHPAFAYSDLSTKCLSYGPIKPNVNPPFQQLNCLLTTAALEANIPPEVVKGVASQESGWMQFDKSGAPIISPDGGIGLMQVTNQPSYDQEKLKSDLIYNIETGVQILSNMYGRLGADLPYIKGADRQTIENWYFPVMAYNGTKPANSPLYQLTGASNTNAYQEKVFTSIEQNSFLGDTKLASFPFQTSDFQYDRNSDQNIQFLTLAYTLTQPVHPSNYFFKKGDLVAATQDGVSVRSQPTTNSVKAETLQKNALVTVTGNFTYDQSINSQNQFVWYPVKTQDQKPGYISSAYLTMAIPAATCSQYHKNEKIYWNGMELKPGQIGKLTVLQSTALYKVSGTKKTFARTLKAGGFYPIYAFKPGMLSVGGGYYVDQNSKVKYETPSKTKLNAVKCIASL